MNDFQRYMNETHEVNRWAIVKVGIGGAFLGALAATIFIISAFAVG